MQMLIQNGQVSPVLTALMEAVGLHVEDRSPARVNEILQQEWVKATNGTIRAKLGGRFPTEVELGLLEEIGGREIPIDFSVDYQGTIVLGATLKAVLRRLWFVASEKFRLGGLCSDVGFVRPIYLLGSQRSLDSELEGKDKLGTIISEVGVPHFNTPSGWWPSKEMGMMTVVATGLNLPDTVPFSANDVKVGEENRPANTTETIYQFFNIRKMTGHFLLVSSQPFCVNQLLATRRAVNGLQRVITFDVCGPAAPPLPLARWLDNLAKQLWEEVQLLPK